MEQPVELGREISTKLAAVVAAAPQNLPRLNEIFIDARVLVFAFLISVSTGVLFGLAPALTGSRFTGRSGFSLSARGSLGGRSHERLRRALVAAEAAIALVLLTGSGLLIRSFRRLSGVDPGFDVKNLLSFSLKGPEQGALSLGPVRKGQSLVAVSPDVAPGFERLVDDVRTLPGVRAASLPPAFSRYGGQHGSSPSRRSASNDRSKPCARCGSMPL